MGNLALPLSGRPVAGAEQAPQAAGERHRWLPVSRLTLRILAINVLAPAILVGGILYLGQYQNQLIQSRLDSLKGEAKLFASSVAENSVMVDTEEHFTLAPGRAALVRRTPVSGSRHPDPPL